MQKQILAVAALVAVQFLAAEPSYSEDPPPQTEPAKLPQRVQDLSDYLAKQNRQLRTLLDPRRTEDVSQEFERIEQQLDGARQKRRAKSSRLQQQLQELQRLAAQRAAKMAQASLPSSADDTDPEHPGPPPAADPPPRPITQAPVDQLSLADSLFGDQDYQTALAIYQQLDQSQLAAADRNWVNYQMACCYRKLGDIPHAEKFYRLVTAGDDGGYLGRSARWWLEVMRRKVEVVEQHDRLKMTLEALEEDVDD